MRVPKSDRLAGMDFLEITRYQANGMFAVKRTLDPCSFIYFKVKSFAFFIDHFRADKNCLKVFL